MVVKFNREEADFILECLKDYKRLIKKYYGQGATVVMSKLKDVIKRAEQGKLDTEKEKNLISEKEARGASCEKCE